MRTLINFVSLAGLVLGLYLLYALLWTPPPAQAFASFPVGVTRHVQLEVNRGAFRGQTAEERLNQARDWLLYAAVASAGLTAEEISQRLFDVPVIRQDYLAPVADFRYGPARSCDIGGGALIALLPPESATGAEERLYQLTHLADEYRKDTGVAPDAVIPFEYVINFDVRSGEKTADVTRQPTIPGRSFYTPESGYHEATVRDAAALKEFLSRVDDLTVARFDASYFGGLSLTLGGRKTKGRAARGLDVEDVAAVWRFAASAQRPVLPGAATEEEVAARTLEEAVGSLPPAFTLEPAYAFDGKDNYGVAYHHAKYGEHLAGTKAGMTLFYTDLLAKLWALDFLGGRPDAFIGDLRAQPEAPVAPMYWPETLASPHVRTRFEHLETAFLEPDATQLVFARNVVKLDATSSAYYPEQSVGEVNPHGAAFLRWWERHREEIFRFEPEFARLNQILKWQALTLWLHRMGEEKRLSFLTGEPAKKNLWFPDWAPQQTQLRFKDWGRLGFNPRGHGQTTAESLAALQTTILPRQTTPSVLAGAVWQRGRFRSSGGRPRGGGGYRGGGGGGGGGARVRPRKPPTIVKPPPPRIKFDRTHPIRKPKPGLKHEFINQGNDRALMRVAAGGMHLRGHSGELSSKHTVEHTVAREGAAVTIEARAGGARIGALEIEPTPNGFRVGWKSRDVDLGQSLARRVSRSKEPPEAVLGRDPNVEAVIKLEGEEAYLVKALGSDNWTRLTPGARPGAKDWDARVSDVNAEAREIQLQWVEGRHLNQHLNESSFLVVSEAEQAGAGTVMTHGSKPPPPAAAVVEQPTPYGTLRIHTEASGKRSYISVRDLPPGLREEPARLARVLSANRRQAPLPGLDNPFARQVQNKAYREAAGDIARDPRAFKQHLDKHFNEGVQDCDRLLRAGHTGHALDRVDEMIAVYGRRPELMVLRGVAQLRGRQAAEAARSLELAAKFGEAQRGAAFYNEINSRLGQTAGAEGAPVLAREGEALSMHYNLKTAPPTEAVPLESIKAQNSLVYVENNPAFKGLIQDTPGVNNVDWYVPVKASIQQAVEARQAVVVRLPRGGIAEYQPTVVYAPNKVTEYRAVARTRATQRFHVPVRTGHIGSAAEEEEEEEEGAEADAPPPEVYLVLALPPRARTGPPQ